MHLNNSDLKLLNDMIRSSYVIDKLYSNLEKLETENKVDSLEYSKTLDNLRIAKSLEDSHYELLNNNYKMAISFIDYLNIKSKVERLSLYEIIISESYKNRIILRTLNNLNILIENNYQDFKDKLPNELKDFISKADKDNEILKDVTNTSGNLKNSFRLDIFRGYLYFLNSFIINKNLRSFGSSLIINKYKACFLYKNIESELIVNAFKQSDVIYLGSKLQADMFNLDYDIYNSAKSTFSKNISVSMIKKMLKVDDIDYSDIKLATHSILIQAMLRSSLLLLSESEVQSLYSDFKNYVKNNDCGRISESEVNSCFVLNKADKEKVNVLSLKI